MGNQQTQQDLKEDISDSNQIVTVNLSGIKELEAEFLNFINDKKRRDRWQSCLKQFKITSMEDLISAYGLDKESKVGRRCNEAEHLILNNYFLKKQKEYETTFEEQKLITQNYIQDYVKNNKIQNDIIRIEDKEYHIRNILIVGITGQGKTTFINSFITYLKGFNTHRSYENFHFRYYIDKPDNKDVKSHTQSVQSYQIIYEDYLFNLIDTPGLGDTEGLEKDQRIVDDIAKYLQQNLHENNQNLHAVLIISQSSTQYEVIDNKLTLLQTSMLSILKLFGKQMSNFAQHCLSFSDFTAANTLNFESPNSIFYSLTEQQLQFIHEYQKNVQEQSKQFDDSNFATQMQLNQKDNMYQQYYQFQNSVFQLKKLGFIEKIQIKKNVENYFSITQRVKNSLGFELQNSVEVIAQRKILKQERDQIHLKLKNLITNKNRINDNIRKIQIYQNRIQESSNFEFYEFVTECKRQFQPQDGMYFTNCLQCNKTCCDICPIRNEYLSNCVQMMKSNNQIICQSCNCQLDKHINEKYRWSFTTEQIKRINLSLQQENENAKSQFDKLNQILVNLQQSLNDIQEDIKITLIQMKKCFELLLSSALYTVDIQDEEAYDFVLRLYPEYKEAFSEFQTQEDMKVSQKIRKDIKEKKLLISQTLLSIKTQQFQDQSFSRY
ncbi:unnamed protein product [Paramecium pentaurelia]|uniref:Tr-type G domain-containing protein n=1 Tax=Paramecium pentaurelia TaxID=43138 RepID=A0A8S1VT99_9CILI|nr:unnamed protein product [Paramecium pentaurelia]